MDEKNGSGRINIFARQLLSYRVQMRKQVETAGIVRFMTAPSVSVMEEGGAKLKMIYKACIIICSEDVCGPSTCSECSRVAAMAVKLWMVVAVA